MHLRTIADVDLSGLRVLLRLDLNMPVKPDGMPRSDRCIVAAMPTIESLLERRCSLVIAGHRGNPAGKPRGELSMEPVYQRLRNLLPDVDIHRADDVCGSDALGKIGQLQGSDMVLLENVRFEAGETEGSADLARRLADMAEAYVNDAFAASHRGEASTLVAASLFQPDRRAAGLLMQRELAALDELMDAPQRPIVLVLGGAKTAQRMKLIKHMLDRVDRVLLGGAMAYTFLSAAGRGLGESIIDADKLDLAAELLDAAGERIELPRDLMACSKLDPREIAEVQLVPDRWEAVDLGPRTQAHYADIISGARTVVWHGPMGRIEDQRFRRGSRRVLEAMLASQAKTYVGGAETAMLVEAMGGVEQLSHVSTGGSAMLEYMRTGTLAALAPLAADASAGTARPGKAGRAA